MLGHWSFEGLIVPGITQLFHAFTESKGTYTVGKAENDPDITITTPVEDLHTLRYRRYDNECPYVVKPTSYDVISETRYFGTQYPTAFHFDRAYPLAKLYFDREAVAGDTIEMGYRGHFSDITLDALYTDTVEPGYYEALVLNLAVKLAPSYGKDGRQLLLVNSKADEAVRIIQARNLKRVEAPLDPALKTYSTNSLYPRRLNDDWW